MVPMMPDFISEEEGWDVINYLRTFKGKSSDAFEASLEKEATEAAKIKAQIELEARLSGKVEEDSQDVEEDVEE